MRRERFGMQKLSSPFRLTDVRQFHFALCFVTAIATFSYYAMLSGQGWLITPACRQMFYVRYIEWMATTPLLMLVLGMLAEADIAYILAVMGGSSMMIFGGLMATISSGHIKWLWFTISLGLFLALVFVMLRGFKAMVEQKHPAVLELYTKVSTLTAISWALYPAVFIFSEGTGDWSPNFEIMLLSVLDILSKVAFGYILLLNHEGLDRLVSGKGQVPLAPTADGHAGPGTLGVPMERSYA
mmetsp:Transcript_86399/g.230805  ORF Transcript_86399/g.230805 Transcript_86399/m.230805 type:complete len:241 (-) Transcript_86399:276-998(-)